MENNTRKIWLDSMLHIVTPVLQALEKEELKKTMPHRQSDGSGIRGLYDF